MMTIVKDHRGRFSVSYEGQVVFIPGVRTIFNTLEEAIEHLHANGFWVHSDLVVERVQPA